MDEAEQKNVLKRSTRKGHGSSEEEAINSGRAIRGDHGQKLQTSCAWKLAWILISGGSNRRSGPNKGEERTSSVFGDLAGGR